MGTQAEEILAVQETCGTNTVVPQKMGLRSLGYETERAAQT